MNDSKNLLVFASALMGGGITQAVTGFMWHITGTPVTARSLIVGGLMGAVIGFVLMVVNAFREESAR